MKNYVHEKENRPTSDFEHSSMQTKITKDLHYYQRYISILNKSSYCSFQIQSFIMFILDIDIYLLPCSNNSPRKSSLRWETATARAGPSHPSQAPWSARRSRAQSVCYTSARRRGLPSWGRHALEHATPPVKRWHPIPRCFKRVSYIFGW